MSRVAIYVRVSTIMQSDKYSLPMQRKDLIAYCSAIIGTDDYVIFEDAGFSAKNTDRPAYQDMMRRVRKHEFTHLLVWKLDRISRNLLDFAQMYSELKELGVTFISRNESFDTSTAMGEAMLKIILVFAELERNMTAERVTATMLSRASSGLWNGSQPPYGYVYDKGTKVISVVQEEKETCILMLEAYKKTGNFAEVARRLNALGKRRYGNLWQGVFVRKVLLSPFTYGDYVYTVKGKGKDKGNTVCSTGHHEPLLPPEEKTAVENIMKERGLRPHTMTPREHPFQGLVYCSCGKKMYPSIKRFRNGNGYYSHFSCANCASVCKPYRGLVTDRTIGAFVIPILSGLVRAHEEPGIVPTEKDLEHLLLRGKAFNGVRIEANCLRMLYSYIGKHSSNVPVDPPLQTDMEQERLFLTESIKVEKRALERLQHVYLYDDDSMTEQEYITKRSEITSKIAKFESLLDGMSAKDSGKEMEYMASHVLMTSYLRSESCTYVDIRKSVSVSVMQSYFTYMIKSIEMDNKKMTSITLYSGLKVIFLYDVP